MSAIAKALSAGALCLAASSTMFAQFAVHSNGKAPCGDVTMLDSHPITSLPPRTQIQIRTAVGPAVQAIVRDPGFGLQNTKVDDVPLNAIPLAKSVDGTALYVVNWDDSIFGVNGAIWIVALSPRSAQNLIRVNAPFSPSGWGIEVISGAETPYPEVMIASKGFKQSGGAEAEDLCMKKSGAFYKPVSCPATCHDNLNGR